MNWKQIKDRLLWWGIGCLTGGAMATDIALARSIDPSKAGVTLWIFLVVGAFIILLQLVPALILIVSFLAAHKAAQKQAKQEE